MANLYSKVNLGVSLDPNEFGGAFGLPPASHITKEYQNAAYPKIFLTPASAMASGDFDTFRMDEGKGRTIYEEALDGYGIKLNWGEAIPFAFLPEAALTDTLTNDYGETFLQKMTDMAGEGLGQFSQMVGAKNAAQLAQGAGDYAELISKKLKGEGENGMLGNFLGSAMGGAASIAKSLQAFAETSPIMQGKMGQIINKIVTNHRFDFPMIWRNSSFSQNPTLTIRLYNPRPGSNSAHKKYILGPLALLLLLAVPRSDTEYGYNWPLFLRAQAPGFFTLKAAGISNMTIVKGGDQNQISLAGPRITTIDIRIEFVSLFSTMVDDSKAPGIDLLPDKPNVSTYIESLNNELAFKRHRAEAGAEANDQLVTLYSSLRRGDANLLANKMTGNGGPAMAQEEEKRREAYIARNYSTQQNSSVKQTSVTNEDIDYLATDRVGLDQQQKTATLIAQAEGFYTRNV